MRFRAGLRSDHNDPIRKPWSVATNNDTYSVPLLNNHAQGKKDTLTMNRVLVNTRRKLRVILGLSPMSTRHGRIVNLKLTEVSSRAKLGILDCLLYTSPSPRDKRQSRMPSSA